MFSKGGTQTFMLTNVQYEGRSCQYTDCVTNVDRISLTAFILQLEIVIQVRMDFKLSPITFVVTNMNTTFGPPTVYQAKEKVLLGLLLMKKNSQSFSRPLISR